MKFYIEKINFSNGSHIYGLYRVPEGAQIPIEVCFTHSKSQADWLLGVLEVYNVNCEMLSRAIYKAIKQDMKGSEKNEI